MISYSNRIISSPYAERIAECLAEKEFLSRIFVGEVRNFDPPESAKVIFAGGFPQELCITISSSPADKSQEPGK